MEITPEFLALIVAVISLISPLLTTLANILFQVWIRKKDLKKEEYALNIERKENLFLSYISSTGKVLAKPTSENLTEYGNFYPKILVYIPVNHHYAFTKVDQLIHSYNYSEARDQYLLVLEIIKEQLQTLHTK